MPQNTSSSSSLFGRLSTSTRSSWISPKEVKCNVQMLHDSDSISNEFQRSQPAQAILDYVCELKNITEKDFLGLRYQDHNKHRFWLDLSRSIGHAVKQFKSENLPLRLRFRYYPADPTRIRDGHLRYQLFVQLQRDLLHGRLYCPQVQAAELAALILQAQIGDYDPDVHQPNYVSTYKLLLKQTPKLEDKITDLHKNMRGKSTADAELEFLEKASQLETYAFDPYTVKDPTDPTTAVYIGASHKGILIFTGTQKSHHIDWSELTKVDYVGREVRITVSEAYAPPSTSTANGTTANGSLKKTGATQTQTTLKYTCPSGHFAKHLWIHILSQQAFFNEAHAATIKPKFSKPRIPLLSRGSTFRFPSQRVYKEIEEINESLPVMTTSLPAHAHHHTNGDVHAHFAEDGYASSNTEGESALNTSTVSASMRYDLPRQESRSEQPWLNNKPKEVIVAESHKSQSDSGDSVDLKALRSEQNNNNAKLNVSLSGIDSQPSTSSNAVTPDYIVTPGDRNQTSFTVHLVKREASRCASPVSTTGDEGVTTEQRLEKVFNAVLNETSSPGEPLAASTPRLLPKHENGSAKVNGDALYEPKSNGEVSNRSKGSVLSGITNTVFVFFLLFVLIIAIVIAIFEKSGEGDFVENYKWMADLRHEYYEPARHYTIAQYRKYFPIAK